MSDITEHPDPGDWRVALEAIDPVDVIVDHAECSTDGFCPTCQGNWRGRPAAWAVDFDSPKHGTVAWPCQPFLLARRLQEAEERVESQAADLSRLREERDALRARTTPPEMDGDPLSDALTELDGIKSSYDPHDADEGYSWGVIDYAIEALRHAYLPPVAPSPDPKDGEQ